MRKTYLLPALLGLTVAQAQAAGGHYPVDDADVGEAGDFAIEAWHTRIDSNNWEAAILPATTLRSVPVELVFGYVRISEDGDEFNRFEPEVKWQLAPIQPGAWGAALSVIGGHEDGQWTDWLVSAPLTWQLTDLPLSLHAHAGWLRERDEGWNNRLFVGGAFEWDVSDQVGLIGQLYREGSEAETEAQLGLRFAGQGSFEHADLAVGRELGGEKDWSVTLGFTLAF